MMSKDFDQPKKWSPTIPEFPTMKDPEFPTMKQAGENLRRNPRFRLLRHEENKAGRALALTIMRNEQERKEWAEKNAALQERIKRKQASSDGEQ